MIGIGFFIFINVMWLIFVLFNMFYYFNKSNELYEKIFKLHDEIHQLNIKLIDKEFNK